MPAAVMVIVGGPEGGATAGGGPATGMAVGAAGFFPELHAASNKTTETRTDK
jgi:hypothetical protein